VPSRETAGNSLERPAKDDGKLSTRLGQKRTSVRTKTKSSDMIVKVFNSVSDGNDIPDAVAPRWCADSSVHYGRLSRTRSVRQVSRDPTIKARIADLGSRFFGPSRLWN
jgi:hypothetical protein